MPPLIEGHFAALPLFTRSPLFVADPLNNDTDRQAYIILHARDHAGYLHTDERTGRRSRYVCRRSPYA